MSARLQIDAYVVNDIILKGFEFLKYRPIFEDYDDNRSDDMEYLSAILHTNEFQQLKDNIYFPQTEENLQTHYKDVFDDISKLILKLESNNACFEHIADIKTKLDSLYFSTYYLNKNIFNNNEKVRYRQALDKMNLYSYHDFINDKELLLQAIDSFLNKLRK